MTLSNQPEIKVGQVWVEMDPRMERYIAVTFVRLDSITIIRVNEDGSTYPGARHGNAMPKRFNGARGGYAIHRDNSNPPTVF